VKSVTNGLLALRALRGSVQQFESDAQPCAFVTSCDVVVTN